MGILSLSGLVACWRLSGPRTRERKEKNTFRYVLAVLEAHARLINEGRGPRTIVLENVVGALTSNNGKDFAVISSAFAGAGYKYGAVVIDARHFVPQSRSRLFILAIRPDQEIPTSLASTEPLQHLHTPSLLSAFRHLSDEARRNWIWWSIRPPAKRNTVFADLIDDEPAGVEWDSNAETKRLLGMMSKLEPRQGSRGD